MPTRTRTKFNNNGNKKITMTRTKFNGTNGNGSTNHAANHTRLSPSDVDEILNDPTIGKLTPKQRMFVHEYLIDLNSTQAAIRAGYSPHTASVIATENLGKPNIRAAINKAMALRSRRVGITQDRVLQEIARVAFMNVTDLVNVDDASIRAGVSRDDTAAIASIRIRKVPTQNGISHEREVRFHDKLRALEMLGKHLGMFTDKVSVNADLLVKIVDDVSGSGGNDNNTGNGNILDDLD